MKYCSNCRAEIRGDRKRCPLCNTLLTGEPSESGFPAVPDLTKIRALWLSIAALASVSATVVCILYNILHPQDGPWCLYAVFGLVCGWALLLTVLRKARNASKAIILEVYLGSALCFCWDWFTGWMRWSVNFVIPAACVGSMIALMILSGFLRKSVSSFVIYLLADVLLGLLEFVLLLNGILTFPLPGAVCAGVCLITFAAMIIFRGRQFRLEVQKRFHL